MSNYQKAPHLPRQQLLDQLTHAIDNFSHILPAQASIKDFVHHNTLHGFEDMKFQDALKASNQLTGAYGYWTQQQFQEQYLKGRINDDDIDDILNRDEILQAQQLIFKLSKLSKQSILKKDIYRIALLYPLKRISSNQLKWQSEELHALEAFQEDVPDNARKKLLDAANIYGFVNEKEAIKDLWKGCVKVLGLDPILLHPEDLVDLTPERAEKIFTELSEKFEAETHYVDTLSDEQKIEYQQQLKSWADLKIDTTTNDNNKLRSAIKTLTGVEVKTAVSSPSVSKVDILIRKQSRQQIDQLIGQVGNQLTLRGLLTKLTGKDVQNKITAYLLPYISNWLDEGVAAWHSENKQRKGFYKSWKESALLDNSNLFNDLVDWKEHIQSLPDDSTQTVMDELSRMGIAEEKWGGYISRLALDLPGWSGMFYWRYSNPDYHVAESTNVEMMDYLAVRLILEHLYTRALCRKQWLFDGDMATIRVYLHKNHSESFVRFTLYNQQLPEYLLSLSQQLVERESFETHNDEDWQQLAKMIWTWQQCPSSDSTLASDIQLDFIEAEQRQRGSHLHHDGWKLFRLAQHLGICGVDIRLLKQNQLDDVYNCISLMDKETKGFTLLKAYERNYREQLFTTISQNQGRGTWENRKNKRPEAQLIFCMDDREEGFRRHLEHLNPNIETFGAAAFFGVVMNWKGLMDKESVVLCPVVVTPVHEITEVTDKNYEQQTKKVSKRVNLRSKIGNFIHQDSRRSLLSTSIMTTLYAPVASVILVGKVFSPLKWNNLVTRLKQNFDTDTITRINTTAKDCDTEPTQNNRQLGYTIEEQVNIVAGFLQNNGMLSGFAQLVVMIGHYSFNQNNPHTAAYGCGACGGKFSGPNGRVFAAMANNDEVRAALVDKGIDIPKDTWFIGAQHDTCNEDILWTDIDLIPENLKSNFQKLQENTFNASQHSAHERCRKLASAPKKPSLINALKHIAGRGVDFSQARPELGHATIASGFVGRRFLTQGTFLDRRSFLISYDSNVDPKGEFLERILLSAGPVGAGINLEYYFSSVNNEKYGSGSKIVHNLSGLLGVMEGGSSDLRTGLPQQMIEIHEPMRLQLMVEAKTGVLTEIYKRQPSIQQLVGNGWILLSAKDPDSEAIHTFDPEKGWELWKSPDVKVKTVKKSEDWYSGNYDHLPTVLVKGANNA
jgi:uncharacterized protein YbcC (UPF0753/DUF2309 family)